MLANAKVVVVVFDENQILSTEQIWEPAQFAEMKLDAKEVITLKNQMRINSSKNTVDWIRNLIDNGVVDTFTPDDKYDLKVFESPAAMYDAIKKKSEKWNLSYNCDL